MGAQSLLNSDIGLIRRAAVSDQPNVLAEIYQDDINIAIWQDSINQLAKQQAEQVLDEAQNLNLVVAATPTDILEQLASVAELSNKEALCQHIQTILDMFCTLFELKRAGLRLTILDKAMCPKFHVDKIPCRLVSTFFGPATQWLLHQDADQTKLGAASAGLTDEESGIYKSANDTQQLQAGDVALLKGSGWQNNESAGLVHRSPPQQNNDRRLVITLDFID